MVARAILDEMRYGAASRRERPVSSHLPYTRHVDDQTLRTKDGYLVTVLKLDGFCFETADMAHINNKLEGRNDILRTLGNSRYAFTGISSGGRSSRSSRGSSQAPSLAS